MVVTPAARPVLSSSGGRAGLGPGIDVRGPGRRTGGYLIGPGSVVHGARYTLTCDLPPAELPTWVLTGKL
ncbi:bifunctional DNA primase/polymerase [Streptomyces sp. NRRL S-1868]|uniref:bifunctional DNA primase/polymerase n=1 Tax=Streptomyces sp. NRRL S-1868 TaxID=1463892 RepID=UPI0004C83284